MSGLEATLLDSALANMPIGLAFLDRQLRYLRVNAPIEALIGHPERELVGRTLREINPAVDSALEALIQSVIASGVPMVNVPRTRPMGAGRARDLLLNVFPLRASDGEVLGAGIAVIDVTDRSILQEQFHQAQKLETVGRLAAGVAHDFNNLLTVIRSYCDILLLEMPEDAEWRVELEEMRSAADRASTLARQMIGAGQHHSALPRLLEFREVIVSLEPLLRRATRDDVDLVVRADPAVAIVRLDPSQLEQVLLNLVINAVDAMPNGGRILIETRNVWLDSAVLPGQAGARSGAHVLLRVTDDGEGMSEETRRRVFEPFYTTKSRDQGTGLGLSTVYGIVQQMGGAVSVESEQGHGTTFTILLPRDEAEEATGPRRTRAARESLTPLGNQTVLVADDDPDMLASLTRGLERLGYVVLAASHGGEALRLAKSQRGPIHLLVTDVDMPGMDGVELARRIVGTLPHTKVLFMSGSAGDEGPPPGRLPPASAFLAKPFSFEELSRALHEVLNAS